jgi:transposase-like protein
MTHARQRAGRASDEPVTWQPLSALPLVSHLIDSALTDSAEHIETLTKVSTKPHVFDDAIVDRIERVHREQLHFVELYAEQLRRWRTENPSVAQRQQFDRLETHNSRLRQLTAQILVLAVELRKGTLDRIMEKSDLDLGLEALARYSRAED